MDQKKIDAHNEEQKRKAEKQAELDAAQERTDRLSRTSQVGSFKVAQEVTKGTTATREVKEAVTSSSQKVIDSLAGAQGEIAQALNNLVVATVVSKDPQLLQASRDVAMLLKSISTAGDSFKGSKLNLLPAANDKLAVSIDKLVTGLTNKPDRDYTSQLEAIQSQLGKIDVKPVVNVPKTDVKLDLKPLLDAVKSLQADVKAINVEVPEVDFGPLAANVKNVQKSIESLRFPVANFELPFVTEVGKATQLKLTSDGKVPVSGTLSGGGDGAILDGVDSGIKATVFDYANSNPVGVVLRDTSGDYVSVGGGTQYTEDASAAANPVGTAVNLVRADTPATVTNTDGDNVSQRGTNYGAAYTQVVTSAGAFVDSFGGGTQYTEDAAAAANPVGSALIVIREDGRAGSLTTTDGDNVALRGNNLGELYVKHTDAIAVTSATFATAAKQDTGNASLSSIDGKITAVNTGAVVVASGAITETNSGAIKTSVELIDDTVKTLGTDTYTEATTKGQVAGAVRRDANTSLVDTTNEIAPLQVNATGELKVAQIQPLPAGTNAIGKLSANSGVDIGDVDITSIAAGDNNIGNVDIVTMPAVTVTGVSTLAEQQTQTTALQLIDDIVYVDDTATHATGTSKGALFMAAAVPTDTSVNANDIGAVAMTTDRKLHVAVMDALPAGTAAIGKLAANSGVDIGDVDVLTVNGIAPAFGSGVRGATVQRVTIATDDVVPASQSGTWTVQPGNTANSTPWLVTPGGNVAHDAADSGSPVKIGLKAETSPKGITVVADGDRTDAYADADGMQMVKLNTSGADLISERVTDTGGTSTAFTNFSAVASTFNYITAITVYNSSSTAGYVDFRDGTGGSVKWTMPLPAGGGATLSSATPLFKTTANTALAYDVSAALTTVYISISGFQSKV